MEKSQIKVTKILVGGSKLKYFRAIYNLIRHRKDCDLILVAFRGQEISKSHNIDYLKDKFTIKSKNIAGKMPIIFL